MRLGQVLTIVTAGMLAGGCSDPVGPEPLDPGGPLASHAADGAGAHGIGSVGPGAAIPGGDRQDFDFDVAWDLSGRLSYRDWSVVRPGGAVATITVSQSDDGTWIAAFRNGSAACADPTRGAELDGTGRLDTGELVRFTAAVCDNGPSGSGADRFHLTMYGSGYARGGSLSSGDIVKSTGTALPPATGSGIDGVGVIGPGGVMPGSDRQEFTFHVSATLVGTMSFADYSVVRNGLPGRMVVDPIDPATGVTSFHRISIACARFGGTGRLDTGQLWSFYVDACDNADPGAGFDTFAITLPDRLGPGVAYTRSGTLREGDIRASGGLATGAMAVPSLSRGGTGS